ncbi:MAG: sugar ABC transporter permease [Chloroflexi bacterium]|nr:MAG: sugar ABC transporter permease [Chloroflexota bacterium]TME16108.1 MAG: sugar ABC transporter permease [Chloroflexota bacterium]
MLLTDVPTLVVVIVGVPAVLGAYILGGEFLVRRLPDRARGSVRPWIWVAPALFFVTAFLVAPAIGTVFTSFQSHGGDWIGLTNYQRQLVDFPNGGAWIAIRNNLYWLVLYTLFVLFFGLLLAVLFDRVPYESVVKSLIFMPMAISAVALGVIWKFMFWYQPADAPQTGTLNAIVVNVFHQAPKTWLTDPNVNNFALIAAAIWGITGFSMVILSAALKGIPADLLEAARVDGAGEITIFRRVIFPLMMPTVVVVGTTLVIFALKAFDIVYVMTAGNFGTDVLANRMYKLLYQADNPGGASAVAIILLLAVIPVLIFNLRQFRAVEARR